MTPTRRDTPSYLVLLEGFDLDGLQLDSRPPAERLAEAFGIDRAAAARLVSDLPTVVKESAPEDVAQRYANTLRAIGATVRLHIETAKPARRVGSEDGPRVTCPHCGFAQPTDDECLRCGGHLPAPSPIDNDATTIYLGRSFSDEVAREIENAKRDRRDSATYDLPPALGAWSFSSSAAVSDPSSLAASKPGTSTATGLRPRLVENPDSSLPAKRLENLATKPKNTSHLEEDSLPRPLARFETTDSLDSLPVPPGRRDVGGLAPPATPEKQVVGELPEPLPAPNAAPAWSASAEREVLPLPKRDAAEVRAQLASAVPLSNFFEEEEAGPPPLPERHDRPDPVKPTLPPEQPAVRPRQQNFEPAGVVHPYKGSHNATPSYGGQQVDLGTLAPHVAAPPKPTQRPEGSFYAGIIPSLIAPFRGPGIAWLFILGATLSAMSLASCMTGWLALLLIIFVGAAYLGLQANYFARSVESGLYDERRAPEVNVSFDLFEIRDRFVAPGLALGVLAFLLYSFPVFLAFRVAAVDVGNSMRASMPEPATLPEGVEGVAPLHPPSTFFTDDGEAVVVVANSRSRMLRTADGRAAFVEPAYERVTYVDNLYVDEFLPLPPPQPQGSHSWSAAWLLVVLAMLFPFYYWPMAIAVGAISNSLITMFNPVTVVRAAVRGGIPYLLIAAFGLAAPVILGVVFALVALAAGPFGLVINGLLSATLSSYVMGAQGQMLGHLIATRPDAYRNIS